MPTHGTLEQPSMRGFLVGYNFGYHIVWSVVGYGNSLWADTICFKVQDSFVVEIIFWNNSFSSLWTGVPPWCRFTWRMRPCRLWRRRHNTWSTHSLTLEKSCSSLLWGVRYQTKLYQLMHNHCKLSQTLSFANQRQITHGTAHVWYHNKPVIMFPFNKLIEDKWKKISFTGVVNYESCSSKRDTLGKRFIADIMLKLS